ncbi:MULTISPECIES: ABC transporter permease [Deinococcus]|jgi:peptide/nickel transport system permease protein|uniref:Peptide ABC transporter permease n=1 Tax=Deinococcus soli (ex Cha et al. 2016) TaxID=1309411 RepID=A0A0F7JLW4_9DEIO|nr:MULTISPECIES: ABC transporter permease [Deinococcus]AKH16657.1 peptide ABC transporter permease [Deinococcus soli (ex Cha et al. 2016)]MDK2013434.1 ABC transporter permease [Deinococcus sp. 43]
MLNFIVKRLIQIPVVMLVLSLMIVGLTQLLTPEQRAAPYIRSEQQAARLEQIIEQRGLRDPFPVQYSRWLGSTLQGDLGYSKASNQDVIVTIKERLPRTVELTILTAIPILLISVWLGTLSALHKDKFIDQLLRVFVVLGYSLPSFVVGILLLAVFYAYLGWLPGSGQLNVVNTFALGDIRTYTGLLTVDAALNGRWDIAWDALQHMILPALTLVIVLSANIIKVMRNNMLEALTSDYVRTARAKGLSASVVNRKHARRNALLSIVTLGGFLIIGLLGGSLITETIFAFPGIGQWVVQAAVGVDLAAVLGFAMLTAVIVVVVSTIVDILYGVIDPRVRFD